jgi:hypothetical protein
MNALMAEILEGHVRLHLLQSNFQKTPPSRRQARN